MQNRSCIPGQETRSEMTRFYQTSEKYLQGLNLKDEGYFKSYISIIQKHLPSRSKVLDLACGNGFSSFLLAKIGYEVTGVDISHLFIKNATINNGLSYVAGDALALPFKDACFGAIACFEGIEHFPNVDNALREMMRVIRRKGLIIIVSPNLLSPFLPLKDIVFMALGREGRATWAENMPQAFRWLVTNTRSTVTKLLSSEPVFCYRGPNLLTAEHGDADSVYLSTQIDIVRFLRAHGMVILRITGEGLTVISKITARMFPYLKTWMAIVARKDAVQ